MTPAAARIKRAVREAIAICGGVDGAGATAGRCRSTAGDWNNLNADHFPPADCALALDEVAAAQRRPPPIASALARELGGAFVPLPDALADPDSLPGMVMELAREFGELSGRVIEGLADGDFCARDVGDALDELHDVERVAARLRLALEALRETEA